MPGKNPSRGKDSSDRAWDLKEIERLIDVLIEREITEFEMEKGGFRVRIKRGNPRLESGPAQPATSATLAVDDPSSLPSPAPPASTASPAPVEPSAGESIEGLYIIKSPIVGTFYASPAPNAPPFVKSGDVVEIGQTLCVIEAMKLMNDIEAEVSGEIVRIYVENGQPVEYGQSLFAIKASHKK